MSYRIPESPPVIKPIDPTIERPLWSVMIPAYNCSKFLQHCLQNVLDQDEGTDKMQIEVVDDCSTDADVKSLVETIGKGRVGYFRQEKNQGSLRNFETCINRAKGYYIHLLHGDDFVDNGFYKAMEDLLTDFPQAGAACCGFWHVGEAGEFLYPNEKISDERGILTDWLDTIAQGQKLQPPSVVVKREVYEKLGGFFGVHYSEDWEMWVRIAAHYQMAYTPEILAEYRVHRNSISHRSYLDAKHVEDMYWVIKAIQKWLPDEFKKELKKQAAKNYAEYAIDVANGIWHQTGNRRVTHRLLIETAKMHLNKEIFSKMLRIYTKMIINKR